MGRSSKQVAQSQSAIARTPRFDAFGVGQIGPDLFSTVNDWTLLADMWRMAETDETVGAMFWCITSAIRQIKWEHVPMVDGIDDTTGDLKARERADFMNSVIHDMNAPFGDHIEDSLTMMWAGFSMVEMVTKRRDGVSSRYKDKLYGFSSLNCISQMSVSNWKYDAAGQLATFSQIGNDTPMPLSKFLLYRTSTAYNQPKGRPLLKNAWRAWRLKMKIQDSEAIGIERDLCGLPVMRLPKDIIDAQWELDENQQPTLEAQQARALVSAAQTATQDMRLNKSGGLVIPSDTWASAGEGTDSTAMYDFDIITTGGQRTIDARTAARDYDHAMARVVLMQFLMLGQRSGGSYGLSDDQSSMALASIVSLATKISDEWNKKAIPYLETVNAMDPKYRPRIRHAEINKNSIAQIGQFIAGIGKGIDLWGGDVKMRQALAKLADLPYDLDAQNRSAEQFEANNEKPPEPETTVVPVPAEKEVTK